MGHNYVKEEETFNITRNGTVPKPIAADILAGHVLKADGTWGEGGGGGTVTDVQVDHQSVVDENGVAQIPAIPQVPVQDVEINGTSVVDADGVAEIPAIPDDLNDLSDVSVSSPTNGQVLKYNSTTQKFENANESGGGGGGNVDDVQVNGTSVVDANKIAKITSYKEVTQAQYEALPDTKLSDNILYAIKDGGQAIEGFPPRIYSSEEREIGVWINGKPVYEKVIDCTEFSASANTWIDTGIDIPNGEYIVSCGFAQHSSISGAFLHIAFCKFDNSGNLLAYFADGTYYWSRCLIQYTKTTDTPGSGTWNQQGAISHHYSTDEKVIGTWIDGKPIYELTLNSSFSNSSTSRQWKTLISSADITAMGIDTFISANGSIIDTYGDKYAIPNNLGTDAMYLGLGLISQGFCMLIQNVQNGTVYYKITLRYTKTTD